MFGTTTTQAADTPITAERLIDQMREIMRDLPPASGFRSPLLPYAGMPVVEHRLPRRKVVVGHSVRPLYGPMWFRKVLRFFGICEVACWLDDGPIIEEREDGPYLFSGMLFCSPSQRRVLVATIPEA